jgi:Serpentine type 7TM GPCR chemoreceptor Srsx
LAIIASNLTIISATFLQHFIVFRQSYVACQLFPAAMGKPYPVLLINMLLATLDRFIYTKWPLLHKTHVTVWCALVVPFCCSVGALLGLIYNFLSGVTPFRCGLDPKTGKIFTIAIGTLAVSCILAKLFVYFVAKKASNRHIIVDKEIEFTDLNSQEPDERNQKTLGVHCNGHRTRQMELNATMTLVANLIPIILIVSLSCLYLLSQVVCKQFFDDCEMLNHLEMFYHELILLHVFTDLLVYIVRSLEFRSAVRSLFVGSIQCSPIVI